MVFALDGQRGFLAVLGPKGAYVCDQPRYQSAGELGASRQRDVLYLRFGPVDRWIHRLAMIRPPASPTPMDATAFTSGHHPAAESAAIYHRTDCLFRFRDSALRLIDARPALILLSFSALVCRALDTGRAGQTYVPPPYINGHNYATPPVICRRPRVGRHRAGVHLQSVRSALVP